MKLHPAKLCYAFSPSFLLFRFSVHRLSPNFRIVSHNVKYFLSSAVAHPLLDKSHRPITFQPLSSLSNPSSLLYGPPKVSSVTKRQKLVANNPGTSGNPLARLHNFVDEKSSGNGSTKYALCTALKSCAETLNWYLGVQIHGLIIHNGFEDNLILSSALVDFYAKCYLIEDARRVFDSMKLHDQISWSSIISGYGRSGCITEAFSLFKEMLATPVKPNSFTYNSIIKSCAAVKTRLKQGALLHAHVIKLGFDTNGFVASTLINYYSKCGETGRAALVLTSTVNCDDVLYNSMISGYSQNFHYEEALKWFSRMRNSDLKPTDYTMSIILSACGSHTTLSLGKQVHSLVIKDGLLCSLFVSCALIDMYSKCGSIDEARTFFDQTAERNIVLWTSMVLGYAQHGRALEGLKLFDHSMMEGKFVPDHVCFTAILTACNHAGLLDKGVDYFNKMTDYGLAPNRDQYACLIDLFARQGHIKKAEQLMEEMPFPTNSVMLSSFLSSCRSYGAIKPGIQAAKQLIGLQPNDGSTYVTLARMYAEAGLWDQVAYFKKLLDKKGSRKRDGWSWTEVDRT